MQVAQQQQDQQFQMALERANTPNPALEQYQAQSALDMYKNAQPGDIAGSVLEQGQNLNMVRDAQLLQKDADLERDSAYDAAMMNEAYGNYGGEGMYEEADRLDNQVTDAEAELAMRGVPNSGDPMMQPSMEAYMRARGQ